MIGRGHYHCGIRIHVTYSCGCIGDAGCCVASVRLCKDILGRKPGQMLADHIHVCG